MSSRDAPANDACTVRLAEPRDRPLLQTILDASAGFPDADVHGLQARGLIDAHQVFLAFVAGEPVGCVMATVSRTPVLHGLVVTPDQRGRDYGSTLIQAAIASNDAARGPCAYCTAVDPDRLGAVDRFLRLGFRQVDRSTHGFTLMMRGVPDATRAHEDEKAAA